MPPDTTTSEAAFRRGIAQFNGGEFWEAHESWEVVWLPAAQPDKTFLQGIIQVSAGFHHHRRGNPAGARSLLRRGLAKLERFPATYRGIWLEDLRRASRRWLEAIEADSGTFPESFPAILPEIRDAPES